MNFFMLLDDNTIEKLKLNRYNYIEYIGSPLKANTVKIDGFDSYSDVDVDDSEGNVITQLKVFENDINDLEFGISLLN